MRGAKWIVGLDYEVRGKEQIPVESRVIIACKHQSAWETIMLLSLFEDPAIVLKESLMYIPLFGWFARKLKMIPVGRKKRGATRNLKRMLKKAEEAILSRRPLIIFPEGTRALPSEEKPYYSGVFTLYSQFNIPVIPTALNSGLFWGRREFLKKPGKIIITFCPPLNPGLNRHDFMNHLRNIIESKTKQLMEEGYREQLQTNNR